MYDRILIPVTTRSFSREIDPSFANQLKHLIQAHPNACFMLLYIFEPRDCRRLAAGLPNLDPDLMISLAAHQLTQIERCFKVSVPIRLSINWQLAINIWLSAS
jgi:hypothetical protein